MNSSEAAIRRVVMVRIGPGEDILAGLRSAVTRHGIANGAILGGLGSVRQSHFHVVTSSNLPPAESDPKSAQPLDICSLTGLVIGGRVHAHIVFSDERNAFGGHLEEGCVALTFALAFVGDLGGIPLTGWDSIAGIADAPENA
jgi:predicted DNA-binding protein with PD1-like motif